MTGAALLALGHGACAAPPAATPVPGDKAEQFLYVAINVSDMAKARAFYIGVIGMKEIARPGAPGSPSPRMAFLSYSGTFQDSFLMLNADPARTTPLQRGDTLVRLTFKVRDVAAAAARAKAAGFVVVREPGTAEPGVRVGILKDQDGNTVEIVQAVG